MASSQLTDVLHLLARRADLLECLRDGIQDKRELEETLGVSRSTLNRALNDLEENHLAIEQVDAYTVTPGGNVACQIAQACKPLTKALPVLTHLPPDVLLEPALFRDATVIKADQPNPEAPIDHLENLVSAGTHVKGMSPVAFSRYVRFFYGQIVEQNVCADIVIDEGCFEYLWANHHEKMQAILEIEHCTFWQMDDEVPFGLAIVDDEQVWLGIHDEKGRVEGAIVNDSNAAVEWALDVYDQYCERSEQVFFRGPTRQINRMSAD